MNLGMMGTSGFTVWLTGMSGSGKSTLAQGLANRLRRLGKVVDVLDGPDLEQLLNVGGAEVGRFVFEPGWRWSNDVKPLANTDSCEAPHFQYHLSGRLAIRMDDGTELVAGPGDITSLPSGHDAWVVGDEEVVVVDWYGASNYAKNG